MDAPVREAAKTRAIATRPSSRSMIIFREATATRLKSRRTGIRGNRNGAQQPEQRTGENQSGQNCGNINLSSEQRTKIRETMLNGRDVPRVNNVSFALDVGAAVPSNVRIVAVPETLIELHPEWRGYSYFVVRDDVVIVDLLGVRSSRWFRLERRALVSRNVAARAVP